MLDELLPELAAIAIDGARAVGKTATAGERAAGTLALSDPAQREALSVNLDLVTQLRAPVLIDEWQLVRAVWDRVRRAVDEDRTGGRFLLVGAGRRGCWCAHRLWSGSYRDAHAAPALVRQAGFARAVCVSSGPARRGRRYLRGVGRRPAFICRGDPGSGLPGIRGLAGRARDVQLDGYLARVVDRELAEAGVEVRRPRALRAWLSAYAAATATITDYAKILSAATPAEGEEPARQTAAAYREHLTRLFLLDPVQAWTPAFNPLKRLAASPKHHL